MDPFSVGASAVSVVQVSVKVISLCLKYSHDVKNAKEDIERLRVTVIGINAVANSIQKLLEDHDKSQLPEAHTQKQPLEKCKELLKMVEGQLEPSKRKKVMSRFGIRALKWPMKSSEVNKTIDELHECQQIFNSSLQIDQTKLTVGIDQKTGRIDKKTDEIQASTTLISKKADIIDMTTKKAALLIENKTEEILSRISVVKLPTAQGASFNSDSDESASGCLENTRVEMLSKITQWANEKDRKHIFWLNGMAGTGKSTIARTVCESLAAQKLLGASFFFKRGEGDRGNTTRFFATIATELMIHLPDMRIAIAKALEDDPDVFNRALKDQFEKLILNPLSGLQSLTPFVIVIDALDECEPEGKTREILRLLSQASKIHQSMRIFVTSRPEFHIRLGFRKMTDGTYENLILHEVVPQTIEHDIRLYLEHEFEKIREEHEVPVGWPEEMKINTLVDMAVPLFIFAATVCRFVGESHDSPPESLDSFLKYHRADKKSQLDITYLPILESIFKTQDERRRRMMSKKFCEIAGSIVLLESPLSVKSLSRLIRIDPTKINNILKSLHSVLNIPNDADKPVRLLHLSFREFLTDTKKDGLYPFWVDEKNTNRKLAQHCLEIMSSSEGLQQNMCNLLPGSLTREVDMATVTDRIPSELQYACRYWIHHLEQGEGSITDDGLAYEFLQKHFLHWLEAMSLIGDLNKSVHLLQTLRALPTSPHSSSSRFLDDAARFLHRYRMIIEEAPLQVYYSALIFAPKASIIRQNFVNKIPAQVELLSEKEEEWGACRSVLEGHDNEVNQVSFAPDNSLVASLCRNKIIKLWEVSTGVCCTTLDGHSKYVNNAIFSPGGNLLASSSDDGNICLYETSTGACCHVLTGHSGPVRDIAFSTGGELLASGSEDSTLRLWDTATGECRFTIEEHTGQIQAIAYSSDGVLFASATVGEIKSWHALTGEFLSKFECHSSTVDALVTSNDNQLLVSTFIDGTIQLWDRATGLCRSNLQRHSAIGITVVISPDSRFIASADRALQIIRLWNSSTGECCRTFEGHTGPIEGLSFSPNSELLASGGNDAGVRIWQTKTGVCQKALGGHSYKVCAVAFSADGSLVASGSLDKTVRLWETQIASKNRDRHEQHSRNVVAVAFSPCGQILATTASNETPRLWNTFTGALRKNLEGDVHVGGSICFSSDGATLTAIYKKRITMSWDVSTGKYLGREEMFETYGVDTDPAAFRKDLAMLAPYNMSVHPRWRRLVPKFRSSLEGYFGYEHLSISSDGNLTARYGLKTLKITEAATGTCRAEIQNIDAPHEGLATFAPNNQLIALANPDGTIGLWDIASGACQRVLSGQCGSSRTIAFSPDGELVASLSRNAICVWEAQTGRCQNTLSGDFGAVRAIAFSPDSENLHTNRGILSLSIPPVESSKDRSFCNIFIEEGWLLYGQKRLLWLPPERRPMCVAVCRDMICMGHPSGLFTLLRIGAESKP